MGRYGIARTVGTALDDLRNLAVVDQFQRTGDDIDGPFLGVAFLEQDLLGR